MHRTTTWIVAGALALGLAAATAACSDDDSSTSPASTTGAEVFASNCATCHGADGSGGQGPALGDGVVAAKLTEAETLAVVTNGRNAMPAFEDQLSADELDAVVAYVRDELRTDDRTDDEQATTERGTLSGLPPELEDAEGDWPVANGTLDASRAVLDSPITSETVDQLEVAWTYEAPGGGTFGNFPTNPLVSGDAVYIGDLTTRIHAIDRATGEERFVVGDEAAIFGPTGVGLGYGQLYGTKGDDSGRGNTVVAYDAESGDEVWATDIGANGGDVNVQPIAYDGLVIASTSGYGAGTRGTVYALDAETGAIVWDLPVIEDPDLWGNPELNSGGGIWYPPTIDPERGLAYVGTGNPYPFPGAEGFPNGASRPGDNKWTDSILAIDLETGELVWGHQLIAHDIFDRDAMLTARVDVEVDGEERALAISSGKLGKVTALDAEDGEVVWQTPVGIHQNDELTEIDGPTEVYPGSLGGVQTPMAIAEGTIYTCVMNAPTTYEGPEQTSLGFGVELGSNDAVLVALDAATGEIDWEAPLPGDSFGGATVSGDLVFTSSFAGEVLAFDRATGEQVWSWKGPGGINGWPALAGDQLIVPFGTADPPQLIALELPAS
jgi:outer membrane protein assembly factor BamB/mono/diheme cytochrome c family protein